MSQKPNSKTLGRASGVCAWLCQWLVSYLVPFWHCIQSLNAPIAAFTMAVLLCSYCFSSIRTARRDAQMQTPAGSTSSRRHKLSERNDESWVQQALEEKAQNGKGWKLSHKCVRFHALVFLLDITVYIEMLPMEYIATEKYSMVALLRLCLWSRYFPWFPWYLETLVSFVIVFLVSFFIGHL